MSFLRRAGFVAAVSSAAIAITLPSVAAQPPARAIGLSGLGLPSVVPQLLKSLGKVADVRPDTPIAFSVLLRGRHDGDISAMARSISDPTSPNFRHFLTRSQVLADLDPTPAQTALVETGLRALGAKVTRVSSDGRLIDVSAAAGVLTSALGVHFAYVRAPGGLIKRVALNQPVLPGLWAHLVGDLIGLTTTPVQRFSTPPVAVSAAPAPAYFNGRPCSSYYGQSIAVREPRYSGKSWPFTICGYSPAQIRAAYRVPQTGLTGRGVRIGIVDDYSSRTMVADTNKYSLLHGLPPLAPGQYVDHSDPFAQLSPEVDVTLPGGILPTLPVESPQGWSGEQALDVEMVHTMAPGATIEYYGGDQGIGLQPLEAEFVQVIADDAVQFVSDSWGVNELYPLLTPADSNLMELMLQIGAIEGIGASFSSGDAGDNVEMNGARQADFPSSIDMATSVGGTTLVVGRSNQYVGETYWGTRLEPLTNNGRAWDANPASGGSGPATGPGTLAGAGGGGLSNLFAEPSWQKAVVPAFLTTQKSAGNNVSTPGRVVPDISLVGDSTTGVLVGQTQTDVDGQARYSEFRIGGTSVSSPMFAGLVALAIQRNGGKSLGFVSPAMYAAYARSPHAFRDPSLGRHLVNVRTDYSDTQNPRSPLVFHLRLLGQLSTLHDLKGYDDSTGLGTPCASAFVKAIVTPSRPAGVSAGCGR